MAKLAADVFLTLEIGLTAPQSLLVSLWVAVGLGLGLDLYCPWGRCCWSRWSPRLMVTICKLSKGGSNHKRYHLAFTTHSRCSYHEGVNWWQTTDEWHSFVWALVNRRPWMVHTPHLGGSLCPTCHLLLDCQPRGWASNPQQCRKMF